MTAPPRKISALRYAAERARARLRGPKPRPRWLPQPPRPDSENPRKARKTTGLAARAARGRIVRIIARALITAAITAAVCYATVAYLSPTPVAGAIQAAAIGWWIITTAYSKRSPAPKPKPESTAPSGSPSQDTEPEETP